MPITTVQQDPHTLTLTVVGEFPVSRERLWEAWLDPRQLEQFWGPPPGRPRSPDTKFSRAVAPTTS